MAQIKKEEIKNQILNAALYLFAKIGYKETSISDIAKMAKISVGNVYCYYKSKIEIFKEVVPEEFITLTRDMIIKNMHTGKANTISEQLDNATYQKNLEVFMKELLAHRLQILAFYKCKEEKIYTLAKKEWLACIVQSCLDGFVSNPKGKEEKRGIISFLYRGFLSSGIELLASDDNEQMIVDKFKLLIRYHVSGIASVL